ncbi:WD40 repeat domain-containing protein [Oscillochloris sp. ZM17-4]|uniref:WD40 repeat domain-containing protein n=1 Tax=Oscillochloris sp. ZM17-4 TaxID=2866714 RepID=UPI001C736A17|nr:WD40 repeat domain-containing protein [Oscillochloris sp. ZM17-4]MBX0331190.1 WD40 repeat domain-containing protein [Oscillochloris sp. ZM17-4]
MPPINPYIGARPFRRSEKIYGRAREARDLLSLLVGDRIVLLNSPSGAGKTSLIQAAIIPRLEQRRFAVRPTIRVGAASPVPGANRYLLSVMQSLEDARPADEQLPAEALAGLTLAGYLAQRAGQGVENGQVLIFDQFEEVLTLDPADEATRAAFFAQLGDALADPWIWALFAIREEYVAALEPYLNLVPTRFANTFRLDLLGVESAAEAIRGPALSKGVGFAEGVAERLATDLAKIVVQDAEGRAVERTGANVEPVQLQVVCYRLWERRFSDAQAEVAGQTISAEDVQALGSIDNALEEYYESGVARASAKSQSVERAVRSWFDTQMITRQGFRSQVLAGNEASFGLSDATVDGLTNAYLVREERRRGVTWLELAHDRLIRPVRDSNARWFLANLSPLQRQAEIWAAQGQPPSLLFRDAELAEAEGWLAAYSGELTPDEELFLENCREERRRAEERARQARRIRNLAIGASIAAVLALIAAATAVSFFNQANANYAKAVVNEQAAIAARATSDANYTQAEANRQTAVANEQMAERNARISQARELAAAALTQLDINPELSLMLSLRAATTTQTGDPDVPEVAQTLQLAAQTSRIRQTIPLSGTLAWALAYSPDGSGFAAAANDGSLIRWSSADPSAPPQITAAHEPGARAVAYSPDGRWIATTGTDKAVRLWDARTGAALPTARTFDAMIPRRIVFSSDSTLIAISDHALQGGTPQVRVLDAATLADHVPPILFDQPVFNVAFSPAGDLIATADNDGHVRLWSTQTGAPAGDLISPGANPDNPQQVIALAFAPDGRTLASGGLDLKVHLWDLADRREIGQFVGHSNTIQALAFAPDGSFLVSGSIDTSIRVWSPTSGAELLRLMGHTAPLLSLSISPRGDTLISSSTDQTVRLWSLDLVHGATLNGVASSVDGKQIATTGINGLVKIWDAASGQIMRTLTVPENTIYNVHFSPDGRYLVAAGESGKTYVWQAANLAADPKTLACTPSGPCFSVAFSDDSTLLATSGGSGTVRIWDVATLSIQSELTSDMTQARGLSFSADKRLLAVAAGTDGLRVWDLASGSPVPDLTADSSINSVAFSPQGRRLAVAGVGSPPSIMDLDDGARLTLDLTTTESYRILFSADGTRLATTNADGTAQIWDALTGTLLMSLTGMNSPNDAAFSPDGARLFIADNSGFARVALLNQGQLYDLAAGLAISDLSPAECERFHIAPCTWR